MPAVTNKEITLLASAARTASIDTADQNNEYWRGVIITIDATAAAATPSVVFTLQGKSKLGTDYYTILASVAITATGVTVLRIYPGLIAAANVTVNDVLPRIWRVSAVAGDADSLTYSLSANYLL